MEKVGVDKEQLYELLLLPQWLKSARKKYLPPKPPKQQRKYSKGTPKTRTTPEEIEEVIKLFNMGLTFYAIIDRMGWKSTSRIKKIAKDYNLVR
jgi:DNA invertase Pin-like site-specific DNA recombinase